MNHSPPGAWRSARLVIGLALRRWLNRAANAGRQRKRTVDASGKRTGTPRKGRALSLMAPLLLLGLGLMVGSQTWLAYRTLAASLRAAEQPVVAPADPATAPLPSSLQEEAIVEKEVHGRAAPIAAGPIWHPGLARTAELFFLLLLLAAVCTALGLQNQDLGSTSWSLEWLFLMPVAARGLLSARTAQYSVLNPWIWSPIPVFLGVTAWCRGGDTGTVWAAVLLGLYWGLWLIGPLCLLVETALRSRAGPGMRKNVQALCTLLGMVGFIGIYVLAIPQGPGSAIATWWIAHAPALDWLCWPLGIGAGTWWSWPVLLLGSPLLGLLLVTCSGRLLATGLTGNGGSQVGRRRRRVGGRGLLRGIIGKDLRMLARDRNLLMSTLGVPVVMVTMQMLLNPQALEAIAAEPRYGAMAAFGVAAYILVFGAATILTAEGQTLWLLYTAPQALWRPLLTKACGWMAIALVAAAAILAWAWSGTAWEAQRIAEATLVLVGVVLQALLMAAAGCLGARPQETEQQRRLDQNWTFLGMLLASFYVGIIAQVDAWVRITNVLLYALLALALWDRVGRQLPYLLDPDSVPERRILAADGLAAVFAYSVGQALLMGALALAGLGLAPAAVIATSIAGGCVMLATILILALQHLPDWPRALGLRAPGRGVWRGLAAALATGVGLAGIAIAYRQGLDLHPDLARWRDAQMLGGLQTDAWVLVLLAVGLAPLIEEFLFRGLLFRGLAAWHGEHLAVLLSAAVFAVIHPPISVIPVFLLGLGTAWLYRRWAWLPVPIVAHMAYNAVVVLVP